VLVLVLALVACGGAAPPPPQPPAKTVQWNAPGAMVDVDAKLDGGYVTIVDFWSESCGACHVVAEKVTAAIANDPKVLFRKIDVGDADTPVGHAYQIGALPHYRVYDKLKRLRYDLVGNDCLKAPDIARQLVAEQ
jgi:thiol-disulfide isomerase/thioredoxin